MDAEPPKRRRRSPEERLEAARQAQQRAADRLARKARQVEKYEAAQATRARKLDTRRKIIAGAIALEHMRHDPKWRERFRELLHTYVTKDEERMLFGLDAIAPAPVAVKPAAPPVAVSVVGRLQPASFGINLTYGRKPDGFRTLKEG